MRSNPLVIRPRRRLLAVLLLLAVVAPGCALLPGKSLSGLDTKSRRERKISEQVKKDPFPTAAQAGI